MKANVLRNNTLDFVKLLASFLVVFIHVPFYGVVGEIVKLFSRVAVPLFFMTSGYFCYNNDSKTILRKTKKIATILIFTSCLYNLTNIFTQFVSDGVGGVVDYFSSFADFESWLNLLIFNLPFSATRLWFLFSLIYVYILQMVFNKLGLKYKTVFILSVFGIIIHLLLGSVMPYFGVEVPDYFGRNFLFLGYPFFGFGLIFRHQEERIINVRISTLIICSLLGCGLTLLPLLYNSVSQFSIGTLLLVFVIFTLALQKSEVSYPVWVLNVCKCSLGIYIFHRPVTTGLKMFLSIINVSDTSIAYGIVFPILVCICTAVLVLILQTLSDKIKEKNKKQAD